MRSLHITTRGLPPFASTREKPAQQWRPSTAINKEILFWCESNHGFALLNFAICYKNTFLNKCGYVIHHFNAHFLLYGFFFLLLMTYYLLFILYLFRLGKSVQSLSHVWLFVTPWTAACQASLSITNSQSLLQLMSIESVMPSNHLILCRPLLLPPSIFSSIRVFSSESVLRILEFQLQHQSFQWIGNDVRQKANLSNFLIQAQNES